jgi:hypothetical protein
MGIRKNFVVRGGVTFDTDTLIVDDPNNRVGIKKAEPEYELDVAGVIKASNGVVTLTTAGAPSVSAPDGMLAVDTTSGVFYFRSGGVWSQVSGGGGVEASSTAPSSPSEGDLWFKTNSGETFVFFDSEWLEIGPAIPDQITPIIEAKGDLIVADAADSVTRLGVGSNGHALLADSTKPEGLKWGAVGDVTLNDTQTLTGKTLTSPTINTPTVTGGLISEAILRSSAERWNIVAAASTGTINLDVKTASVWRYTSNATANWTLNFRGDSGASLNSILAVGDSITVAFAATIGATQYRPTVFQVDGSGVTPLWQGGAAPSTGNTNSTDLYVFTIVKTAASPAYVVYASQTRFA